VSDAYYSLREQYTRLNDDRKLLEIQEAYMVLGDELSRREYDLKQSGYMNASAQFQVVKPQKTRLSNTNNKLSTVHIVSCLFIAIIVIILSKTDLLKTAPASRLDIPSKAEVQFVEPAQPLPPNGEYHQYKSGENLAPLNISTPPGTNFFIKLIDKDNGQTALTVFVHGGQTAKIKVPLGLYEMRYAQGSTWYGETYLFGPQTICSKVEKVFTFSIDGNTINGHTVQLYKVQDGNLQTTPIDTNDF
jgi:hypothetical protein